ncbi:hypothetical protein RvY_07995 [Ramazzottius varieornatus]|uniref:Uncharacterized protein n=1 Tax=Ramazzottius varieornatus TaxID=947166 RepID=A0A1D1V479_RAMVA|nr:hypothetical protein RvY_07995 [Ramazzottius varieornatus]
MCKEQMPVKNDLQNFRLIRERHPSHHKEYCILLRVRWKMLCKRRPCGEEGWVDYYGFSVAGGYENGQLLYVDQVNWCMRPKEDRRLTSNDILLEANGAMLSIQFTGSMHR